MLTLGGWNVKVKRFSGKTIFTKNMGEKADNNQCHSTLSHNAELGNSLDLQLSFDLTPSREDLSDHLKSGHT